MRSNAAMNPCSVSRRAFGGDGYITKRLGREEPRDMSDCWRGTNRIVDTVMAAAVAIVQGRPSADASAGTGTMKAV
jgi:hypothetical protein